MRSLVELLFGKRRSPDRHGAYGDKLEEAERLVEAQERRLAYIRREREFYERRRRAAG